MYPISNQTMFEELQIHWVVRVISPMDDRKKPERNDSHDKHLQIQLLPKHYGPNINTKF